MSPTTAALAAGMPYTRLKFTYDSEGRRIQRERYDSVGANSIEKVTKYIYDGWNCVMELDANNEVEKKYAWGTDLSLVCREQEG